MLLMMFVPTIHIRSLLVYKQHLVPMTSRKFPIFFLRYQLMQQKNSKIILTEFWEYAHKASVWFVGFKLLK